jgi:putative phosphoribosyl transferase
VEIPTDDLRLVADLVVPQNARGVVVFAHGSGSSRHSPRNQFVARRLQEAGLATLLLDLLSQEEEKDVDKVFDIDLLAERLIAAIDWLDGQPETERLCPSLFGASTGAAAALVAASRRAAVVFAVVSRGGRPDLAGDNLRQVDAPTLLIVGGEDYSVLTLNEQAYALLHCEKELAVVPGATHLFEEPGTLEQVAELATTWFLRHHEGAAGRRYHRQSSN